MQTFARFIPILFFVLSCSNPTPFLVKGIVDDRTIELEDGTVVKLIGVNKTTEKYVKALESRVNNYVLLYDENYDPVKETGSSSLLAYVYDEEGNCINNYADGSSNGEEAGGDSPGQSRQSERSVAIGDTTEKVRISGKETEAMPAGTLSELYDKNKNAVFLIAVPKTETTYSQGTGFFLTASGTGVSNYHVFKDGRQNEAVIVTIDNHQYRIGRILKSDQELDFIVFEVENDHYDFPYSKLAEKQPGIGEDIFTIGNPRGLDHTLSKGIVSSYRQNEQLIQITAEITHGSSGGPLFNMRGEVVGITTSGIGEANLNFAMNVQKMTLKALIP